MSEKTRAELKEQIKIMNHNYQVIREMHEKGYQYSVGEIKRLQDELERTRKALDAALCSLQDIAESNGDFITGASTTLDAQEYAEMMLDKIKFALEQKGVK